VEQREGLAPVPLAAEQPVAQLVGRPRAPERALLEPGDRGLLRGLHAEAVEPAAVHRAALDEERLALETRRRLDGPDDPEVVLLREVPVALVLARNRHDRAGAVRRED